MTVPAQKPGRSKQDYQTPADLLAAIDRRFGSFVIDLAASAENAIVPHYYSEADDALVQTWTCDGLGWCNPPFGHLAPWVKKAWTARCHGASLLMLVPAGVGANWWRDWVHEKARVIFLNGRLTFVGQPTCYPKDCALLYYTQLSLGMWYDVWDWKRQR